MMTGFTIQKYAFRTLMLCGAAMMLFPGATQASPSEKSTFRPAKTWHVHAQMENINGAPMRHCAVSTEFDNGFIMQLDGSYEGLQTISFNLRQTALIKGETYPIILSIPGYETLSLNGMAASQSIIIADIKGQKALYDSLRDDGILDVNIEGNEFRFHMSNFKPAAGGFERCMAGSDIKVPLQNNENAVILQASQSEDPFANFTSNESVAFEKQEIRATEMAAIGQDIAQPMDSLAGGKSLYIPPRNTELPAITQSEEISAPEIPAPKSDNTVIAELALADGDTTAAAFMPDDGLLEAPVSAAEDLNRQQLARIEGRNNAPAMKKTEATTEQITPDITAPVPAEQEETPAQDIPVSEPEPTKAVPVNEEPVITHISSPKVKITRSIAPRIEADFTNIEPASNNSAALFNRDPDIGRKISQLEKMINGLERENEALKDELDTTLNETRQEQASISSDNWNLERASMRYTEAERQLKILGGQLQRERTQCTAEKKDLEAMLFDPNITDQAQMERLTTLERQLYEAEQKLKAQGL